MKRRKICSVLLVAAMAVGMLGGCGNNSTPSNGGTTDGTETGSVDTGVTGSGEVVELTFFNADGQEDPWTDPVALALTEATGVKLKTEYPLQADDESVALMIAEQSYPDMIFAKGDAGSLIEAGALIDMTDLIEEYGPNIKKLYGDEFGKLKYSADDPSIYQLSSYEVGGEKYKHSGTAQVQWEVLKANDYKIPETLDEFGDMLIAYMEEHPTTDDGLETIGFTLSAADWHWMITLGNPAGYIADGAPDNGQWLIDENNEAMYKFRSEKEKEYFRWMNKMYNAGVLDKEFATQTHEDYISKIASGRVLALFDTDWDYQDGEKVLKADGKYKKTYAPLPLTMDADTKCAALMYQGLTTGYGVGISVDCEDPVAAIKFLDYICTDEGQVLTRWGIEGVNYEIDEEGHRYRTQEEIDYSNTDKDYSKKTGVGFHGYPFPYYGDGTLDPTGSTYTTTSKDSVIAEYDEEQKAACEAWGVELLVDIFPQADEFETPMYSPVWAYTMPDEFTQISDQLDEVAWPALVKAVIGSESEFDATYDKMLSDLDNVGVADAEAMLTQIIQDKVAAAQ